MKVATTDQMRALDRKTIQDYEVPGLLLMENAAYGFTEIFENHFGPLNERRVAVVCGKGNNGGDGLAIARHLSQRFKTQVQIFLVSNPEDFKCDALSNYKIANNYGIKILPANEQKFENFDFIVDAIFGTGFKGLIDKSTSQIIENMNRSGRRIISVDVPSGLNSDTGTIEGAVVKATLTATFGFAKYGLLVYPGAELTGELEVIDIGISDFLTRAHDIKTFTTESSDVQKWFPPRINQRDTNKESFGHVVVLAGSRGFSGAPILVAEAALRTGAGLVTLAFPSGLEQDLTARLSPAIMTRGLSQARDFSFSLHALPEALALAQSATAVAIGPGIGLGDPVADFVVEFIRTCPSAIVIDADALTILAKTEDRGVLLIKKRNAVTVLTPHPAELGRLLGISTEAVQKDRLKATNQAVQLYGCVILLKGSRTLISDSSGKIFINLTGNAGLSTAGSGDTLSGILAGLLAQHLEALPAAASAAYLHGLAGDLVAKENQSTTGIIATDLISHLPRAIAHCHGARDC